MDDHRYNDVSLTPLQFLQAVYSDPSVSMFLRMKAAEAAGPYLCKPVFVQREPYPGEYQVIIHITGLGKELHESQDLGHRPTVQPTVHVSYEPEAKDCEPGMVGHA
jgi:hypothetical protein